MRQAETIGISADEVRALARTGVLFGFPLVAMDMVRRAHPTPCARFLRLAADPSAVAPGLPRDRDPDLIASSAWLDLTDGPMVLTLPDLHGRHAVVTLFDAWGWPIASLGSRTTGGVGRDVAVVGPDWRGELACGLSAVRSPSRAVWATAHLRAHGAADLEATRELHRRLFITPLLNTRERPSDIGTDLVVLDPARPLAEAMAELSAGVFFHRLAGLLAMAPATREERPELDALARLGVIPGKPFEWGGWPEPQISALEDGAAEGLARLQTLARSEATGWWPASTPIPRGEAAEARAARLWTSLGAAPQEDVLTLVSETDENGRPLDGAHRYQLRFEPGMTPPAEAFWTLDVLGPDGAPLQSDHGHVSISDRGPIAWTHDRAIQVPVQHKRPARDPANWLIAPQGRFALRLQIHWPRACALDGRWTAPRIVDLGPARGASTVFTAGTHRRPRSTSWGPQGAAEAISLQGGMS